MWNEILKNRYFCLLKLFNNFFCPLHLEVVSYLQCCSLSHFYSFGGGCRVLPNDLQKLNFCTWILSIVNGPHNAIDTELLLVGQVVHEGAYIALLGPRDTVNPGVLHSKWLCRHILDDDLTDHLVAALSPNHLTGSSLVIHNGKSAIVVLEWECSEAATLVVECQTIIKIKVSTGLGRSIREDLKSQGVIDGLQDWHTINLEV